MYLIVHIHIHSGVSQQYLDYLSVIICTSQVEGRIAILNIVII